MSGSGAAASASGGPERELQMNIKCTELETKIFTTLLNAVNHFALPVTLRVAGGWVRDKLMGKESDDIDIALDSLLGREFASKVNEYMTSHGGEISGVGVIQSNPDQSKHLETATMKVHGVWLDLVNLRSETYAEDSRIPEMTFGTAKEDAMRRDLTVNALFYNIHTATVEDLTGMGLEDLRKGIIRTPLAPRTTFLDDPLRVLRAVRFAARFGFEIDPELRAAAGEPEVREALRTKVSRERVGIELEGMLKSADPCGAMRTLVQMGLAPAVFEARSGGELPVELKEIATADTYNLCVASALLTHAVLRGAAAAVDAEAEGAQAQAQQGSAGRRSMLEALSEEEQRWALLAAFLLPLRSTQAKKGKGKATAASAHVIREALKLRAKDADSVALLHESAGHFQELMAAGGGDAAALGRVEAGLALLKAKGLWRLALALAAVLRLRPASATVGTEASGDVSAAAALAAKVATESPEELSARVGAAVETFSAYAARVGAHNLQGVWDAKPLLNGGEVMAAVGMKKAGPDLGKWVAQLTRFELGHPGATKEEAQAWLAAAAAAGPPPKAT